MAPTRPSIMSDGATTSAPAAGVRQRGIRQARQGAIVVHVDAAVGAGRQRSAVAVIGVLAEADVGPQRQRRVRASQGGEGRGHRPLRVGSGGAVGVLRVREAEQDHAGDAQPRQVAALRDQFVDAQLIAPGHRRDGTPHTLAGTDEQRLDEIRRAQVRFAHEAPDGLGPAQPAGTVGRKAHVGFLSFKPK